MDQTATLSPLIGALALLLFALAYGLVFAEEKLRLRKSKPVLVAGCVIWILVSLAYAAAGRGEEAAPLLRHTLLEYAELLLFLLSAMTFINVMVERNVFGALRGALESRAFSLRQLYWITGGLAFLLSPIADNLTTALVMGTVAVAVGHGNTRFTVAACVNIVVAANAGGAFSPFGDITTLMIWQKGVVSFFAFFALLGPALVNWLVPAALLGIGLPTDRPPAAGQRESIRKGGVAVALLFLATIAATVLLHHTLHLPPFLGMLLGLGVLNLYGYVLQRETEDAPDMFERLRDVEWDTLLFFCGIMLCVGGLGALGYLTTLSHALYGGLGATGANVLIGILSAVVDNIPLTFAVLSMEPDLDLKQWLLLTLTAGTGGSLLSIGSAAGVALMGVAREHYTFGAHLRCAWAVALGYAAGIGAHLILN